MNEVVNEVIGGKGSGGGGGGGISGWDPVLKPDYIQAGIYKAPGIFVLDNDFNGTIDDISSSAKGTIIYFFKETQRWGIISGEDKNKGVYSTYAALLVAYPTSTDGDYALITSTNSFFAYYNNIWNDTGSSVAPDALRSTNNLSDLTDKIASRINLGVDSTVESDAKLLLKKDKITPITATTKGTASKTVTVQINTQGDTLSLTEQDIAIPSTQVTDFTEASQDAIGGALLDTATIDLTYDDATNKISSDVKDLSLTNSKIATNADIETSKSKQATITPILATPANNDTQEQINNKLVGLSNNLQSQVDTRPIGASNGSVYYLTSQNSAIANYELLSFSPDPSALDIESVTINSTTAKSSRLIHSYIANADIGAAIINGGNWLFNLFGYVSHLNSSRFEIDVFKRVGTVETLLFTCETTDFSQIAQVSQALNIVNVETTQQDFSCNSTDKIVIKVYGKTDRTQNTTITLLHSGTEYASHIHTPLITSHNNLSGTQGGTSTEKYHLTLAEYNDVQALPSNLNLKQNITDSTLNTTVKTVVGAINELKTNVDLKANDNAVVKLTGDQTIANIKTFTSFPITPSLSPTSSYQVANKQYVDNTAVGAIKYQGTWNAFTNTPTLSNSTSVIGYLYRVNVAGTQNFGAGNISFAIDDKVVYNSSNVWEKWDTNDEVVSVNSKIGAVVLNQDDVLDGATYKQYSLTEKTKLSGIQEGAEVNVQADWNQTDNLQDNFIQNKPTIGTVAIKNVGTAIGNIQENGAILGNSQTVETDATGKFITVAKNDAYNKSFGTSAGTVADGGALALKATSLAFRQESTRFVESTYGSDANNGFTPDKPFATVPTAWNDVNPSGQVKILGGSTYNVGTYTFPALKSSIKTILDNGAKITGTINLVVGNTSMQFFDGKITATINDASGGTCYFTNVDVAGSTLNFSNGGYKFISNSTSAPAVINLTGTGGTLELRDITGGIVPLNIGAGWTVVHYNCTVAILSNAGTIIDGLHIPIAGLIANQTALNVILAQTSSIYFGFYIVNFDNPVITGMTIAKGDVFYKVSATGNAKVYTFGNAPASFSLIVSATQRSTIIKDIDKWVNSKIETDAGLALKQNITDNTLTTTSKTVPGAINELKTSVDLKQPLDSTIVKTSDTATVTSTMILNGTILNEDINASANIATSKSKQATIAQTKAQPTDGNTVEEIINKTLGLINTRSSLAPLVIANLPTGGVIGTAAATVDINSVALINQTTAGQTFTLPTPTNATLGQTFIVGAIGTASIICYGNTIPAGSGGSFLWNGSAWVSVGISSSSGGTGTGSAQFYGLNLINQELILTTGAGTYDTSDYADYLIAPDGIVWSFEDGNLILTI